MSITPFKKPRIYKRVLFTLLLALISIITSSQSISPYMYGQNAWMPSFAWGGNFEDIMNQLNSNDDKPFNLIRIGGGKFDREALTTEQYVSLINSIRSIGAEPLVQVPLSMGVDFAAELVDYINKEEKLEVKFWCIGNEPDLTWDGKEVDGNVISTAEDVAVYYTARATVMKEVDNTIKLFGPDFSFFVDETDNSGWHPMDKWQYPLLKNNYSDIWGKDENGNYYIDYYAFHVYQYVEVSNVERKLVKVLDDINAINSTYRDAENQLGWAITETHITTDNDKEEERNKVWSFYAGQHIAKIIGLGMKYGAFNVSPWSVHESSGARVQYDLGFFDGSGPFVPRSTYHHEFMLSQYAKWNYIDGVVNNEKLAQIATYDETGYAILIMNDNDFDGEFTICLDPNISSNSDFVFNVNAGIKESITGNLGAFESQMVFLDLSGTEIGNITYNSKHADQRVDPEYSGTIPEKGKVPGDIGTDIKASKTDNKTFLYPNPAISELFVDGFAGSAKIEIINMQGKVVRKETINDTNNSIQISEMETGIYFLKIINNDCMEINSFIKE